MSSERRGLHWLFESLNVRVKVNGMQGPSAFEHGAWAHVACSGSLPNREVGSSICVDGEFHYHQKSPSMIDNPHLVNLTSPSLQISLTRLCSVMILSKTILFASLGTSKDIAPLAFRCIG